MTTLNVYGFLRAKKEKAARVLLARIEKAVGLEFSTSSFERYPKDPALFRFSATVRIADTSFRDAYFEVPARLRPISGRWSMTAPWSAGPDDPWDFDGDTSRTSIAGVESLSFSVAKPARPEDSPSLGGEDYR